MIALAFPTYSTLGVVGVERSMSETTRRTSKGRKISAWCICDAPKARPAGPSPHLGCVFVQRHRKRRMARPKGPRRCLGYCSFMEEEDRGARPVGPSRRARFCGVWSKTPNSSPRLAIWCFQGNQYVTLSSTVLFRAIAFQHTVLTPSRALILCALARKSLKITDISITGSRNMAETCAISFLTLVSYSTSIVIGGLRRLLLPILMWAGVDLEYFAQNRQCRFCVFFPFLITHYRKIRKRRETIFGSLVERWVLYWYSLKHLLCSIYLPTGGAANVQFVRCRKNMYKWETLSVELLSAVIIKICKKAMRSNQIYVHFQLCDSFSSWEITCSVV